MTAPLHELREIPEAVRAEINALDVVPNKEDIERIARLAMRETARECAEIARTWGNTPISRGALIYRIKARFGLEE